MIAARGVTVAAVLAWALLPTVAAGEARSNPMTVMPISGATLAVPTAVLVDAKDRIWIAHRPGLGVARPGGVAVYEAGAWRDASTGLDGEVESLHATPQGELFASGRRAAWRWEGGTWVRRLSPRACLSPNIRPSPLLYTGRAEARYDRPMTADAYPLRVLLVTSSNTRWRRTGPSRRS